MKSNTEKWVSTLQNPTKDVQKRYKALMDLKKYYKDQMEELNLYTQIVRETNSQIFQIIIEKMTK